MRKARRVPRRIGQDEDQNQQNEDNKITQAEPISVVKKPAFTSRSSSKSNKSFTPRPSLALDDEDNDPDIIESVASAIRPGKASLKREAIERNAGLRRTLPDDLPSSYARLADDRPSYNLDYLAELKNSTPSTTRDVVIWDDDADNPQSSRTIDIESKFGAGALLRPSEQQQSIIPTDAEIQEKKARRRRLAQEHGQDIIPLNDDGAGAASNSDDDTADPRSRSLIIPADEVDLQSKYGETRLVHEDEDIAEGFDSFVEDSGKVTLGRKGAKEQKRREEAERQELIRNAQHGYTSDSDSVDEDEAARDRAFDAKQTKAGTFISRSSDDAAASKRQRLEDRMKIPKLTPIPKIRDVVARFHEMLTAKEEEVRTAKAGLDRLERERAELEKEEVRVQGLLKDAGERLTKLLGQVGADSDLPSGASVPAYDSNEASSELRRIQEGAAMGRGLESLAGMRNRHVGMAARPRDDYDDS